VGHRGRNRHPRAADCRRRLAAENTGLVGGLALVYIGWKLTHDGGKDAPDVKAQASVRSAVQTIVVADAVMGVDNVLAVAGAAHGSMLLVVIGLGVSVPIVIWGSTLVLKWVERYPAILWLGAAVLGWTGAKMIASEPLVASVLSDQRGLRALLYAVIVGGLVAVPVSRRLRAQQRFELAVLLGIVVWLTGFGWLDDVLTARVDPAGAWTWDESIVDLVRWLGWIPIVIWILRRAGPRARDEATRR
jgi:threonine/homoserine/homoserine lactone efflux protein